MAKKYTAMVLVVDRSGSMSNIASDVEGSLEEFLKVQKELPGKLTVDTVFFDDRIEERATFTNPKKEKINLSLEPRGMTALYDAVGLKIKNFKEALEKLSEDKRPDTVMFVIATDGLENSSKEITKDILADLIKKAQEEDKWDFTFLAANQDAVLTAAGLNIGAGNAITYNTSAAGVANVVNAMSTRSTQVRSGIVGATYSDADRAAALEE